MANDEGYKKIMTSLGPPGEYFWPISTRSATREDLIAEVGRLHMEAERREKLIAPLERLSLWIKKQAVIATPSVFCTGMELESRIVELITGEELRSREELNGECLSCGEEYEDKCPKAKRPCGHHCNHSVTHDRCCWCDRSYGEESEEEKQIDD